MWVVELSTLQVPVNPTPPLVPASPLGGPRGLDTPEGLKALWGNSSEKLGGNKGHRGFPPLQETAILTVALLGYFRYLLKTKRMMDQTAEF